MLIMLIVLIMLKKKLVKLKSKSKRLNVMKILKDVLVLG